MTNLGWICRTLAWLIRDTFRQAASNGLFWVLAALSGAAIVLCATAEIRGERELRPGAPNEALELLPPNDVEAETARKDPYKGVPVVENKLTLLMGRMEIPTARDGVDAVRFLHYLLASGVAETLGVLLAIIWTAGFLPSFLQPSAVTVLLAKPTPRWLLLVGKYLGVMLFVLLQTGLFVVGTWGALGVRTQVWNATYLLAIPLLLLQFSTFFGFSMLLAVFFRSTVVCVLGTTACWLACLGVNTAYHGVLAAPLEARLKAKEAAEIKAKLAASPPAAPSTPPIDLTKPPRGDEGLSKPADQSKGTPAALNSTAAQTVKSQAREAKRWEKIDPPEPFPDAAYSPALSALVVGSYWILPKPSDVGFLIFRALRAGDFVVPPLFYKTLTDAGLISFGWSIATSLLFSLVLLAASAQQFATTDY